MNIKSLASVSVVASVLLLGGCGSSPESQVNSAVEKIDEKFPELHCHWSEVEEFEEGSFVSSCITEDLSVIAFKNSDLRASFYYQINKRFVEDGDYGAAVSVGDTMSYSTMDPDILAQVSNEVDGDDPVFFGERR